MLVRDPTELRRVIERSPLPFAEIARRANVSAGFVSHLAPALIAPPAAGQPPCPFVWRTTSGPVPCAGGLGHSGRHAASNRPRRRSCTPETATALAHALGYRVEQLFEARGPDDPSTGPLPVRPAGRVPAAPTGGRHRAHD